MTSNNNKVDIDSAEAKTQGVGCGALVGCLRWHPIASRTIDGVKHRILRIYRVHRFVGQRWRVVSENRVPLFKAIRYGTPLTKCERCYGTGFVWEGSGDCGPPNYCPDCDGYHSPNVKAQPRGTEKDNL